MAEPPAARPVKKGFLFWKKNPGRPPQRPKADQNPEGADFIRMPLVQVCLWSTVRYSETGVRYLLAGKPVETGSWIKLVIDDVPFSGRVISPPLLSMEQPAGEGS